MPEVENGTTHRSYVYVACSPFSGSTLLASLLGAHPEIATVSEVSGTKRAGQMDVFRCSCQRLMTECPFWLEVQDRARAVGIEDLSLGDFALRFDEPGLWHSIRSGSLRSTAAEDIRDALFNLFPSHRRSMRRLGQRNRDFANVVLDVTHKRVFVETSKEGMRLRYLHRYLGMELKAVHLIRDVRGVVSSSRGRFGAQVDVGAAARAWARNNQTLMRHMQTLGVGDRTLVRYEDLCRDPEETMATLYGFCGVDPSAAPRPSGSYGLQHLLGNRARLQPTAEIRLDERWRTSLSAEDLSTIVRAAAPIAQSLYPGAIEVAG
ncbi:MAG: sulfotransferase [Chloroflexi bacterium]|nr:sulfotransferase [Chloroflexota bacterium]